MHLYLRPSFALFGCRQLVVGLDMRQGFNRERAISPSVPNNMWAVEKMGNLFEE